MPGNSIITIAGPEQLTDRTWRRFLAGLCLLEFYVLFVHYGTELLRWLVWGDCDKPYWLQGVELIRAIVLLGFGRALWLRRKYASLWGVASFLVAVVSIYVNEYTGPYGSIAMATAPFDAGDYWLVPLLATLMAAGWCAMRSWLERGRIAGWALVGAAWCFAQTLSVQWYQHGTDIYAKAIGNTPLAFRFCRTSYVVALACLGLGLLLQVRAARLLALALACMALVATVVPWYASITEFNANIRMLMISTPGFPQNPSPLPVLLFNVHCFLDVFLILPRVLVPFLLIAWYVRHVPMRGMPDDGTPYPRFYCSQCGYNLRGLTGGNCPECGAAVDLPLVATSTPSAAS